MSGRYASFMVDPLTSFGDYHMQKTGKAPLPSENKLSEPIYIQTSYATSTSSSTYSPPPLSRSGSSGSSESLRGPASPATPITPARDVGTLYLQEMKDSTKFREQSNKTPTTGASLMPAPHNSDLRFSFEQRVSKEYEPQISSPLSAPQSPPQLLKRYSERDRHARPPTTSPPRLNTSISQPNLLQSQTAPPTTTSFAEFRQALAERHEARRQEAIIKDGPDLSFLDQDPFQCPLTKRRPKSAGRQDLSEDECSRPASRKSSAPSATSARSSKSIKRGLYKVRKLLKVSRKDVEKENTEST